MGQTTKISYVDHTFNPWWGYCPPSLARAGCLNCYACAMDHRLGMAHWGRDAPRRFFPEAYWARPLAWDRKARAAGHRARVLCGSMCDWLEDRPDLCGPRDRLTRCIHSTPHLDWLLLSKRLDNIQRLARHPLPENAWLGATAEDQTALDDLALILPGVRAWWSLRYRRRRPPVVFISAEPLLGRIDFAPHFHLIDWIILGGESGPAARPMHLAWVRWIRDQCQVAAVPFFFKQWGEWLPDIQVAYHSATYYPPVERLILNPTASNTHRWPDGSLSYRVSKKVAGRLLDGREHLEIPDPSK